MTVTSECRTVRPCPETRRLIINICFVTFFCLSSSHQNYLTIVQGEWYYFTGLKLYLRFWTFFTNYWYTFRRFSDKKLSSRFKTNPRYTILPDEALRLKLHSHLLDKPFAKVLVFIPLSLHSVFLLWPYNHLSNGDPILIYFHLCPI